MLHVVKLSEAKRGFVLLPRRWVVERSFAWMTRFRRLAKDFERLPKTVAASFRGVRVHHAGAVLCHEFITRSNPASILPPA